MKNKLQSNIWKYALYLTTDKRIFISILAVYYLLTPGINTKSVGLILLIGNLSGFLFEMPSGYISDKIGHKRALVLSKVFMLISTVFYIWASSITLFIVGAVLLSLSRAFMSGTGNAFIHETLRGLNKEKEFPKIMGRISSIGFALPIILTVLVPLAVNISYKIPFIIMLIVDIVGLIGAISLVSPKLKPEEIEEIGSTNFKDVIKEGFRLGYMRFAIFIGTLAGITYVFGIFRSSYQAFLEVPVIYFGIFFGIGRAIASVILIYSGKIKKKTSIYSLFMLEIIVFTLFFLVLGLCPIWWVVILTFIAINSAKHGLNTVHNSYLLDVIKDSKFKATLLSVRSQIDKIIGAIVGLGIGVAVDLWSYQTAFLLTAIFLLILLGPLYLFILRSKKDLTTT